MNAPAVPASIDSTYVLLAIAALMLCSVITRAGYLLFGDRLPLPDNVRRALRYAPVAALVAIIVPDLLPWDGTAGLVLDMRLPAAVVATIVMVRTRSAMLTIIVGMLALWAFRWLAG